MHLIGLVETTDHVCCRYRLQAFGDSFAASGHTLELRPLPQRWWDRVTLGRDLSGADLVILQRKLLPAWQFRLLRHRVRRLVFDLDDAVWMRDSYASRGFHCSRRFARVRSIVPACDAVVAGNEFLADQVTHLGARQVHVVPTCVEPSRYPVAEHDSGPIRLTWIGSSSTLQGLEQARATLEPALQAGSGVRLRVICDRFPEWPGISIEPCPWSEADEGTQLAAADVGIAWMPDDPWSRGKCGLKVLQYMAAGLPVIANPVGVHCEMIHHGVTGFLAESAEEWANAVLTLAHDPALRRRMGQAGRARIEADYSVAAGARQWLRIVDSFQTGRRAG